jgi:hypothetical protein
MSRILIAGSCHVNTNSKRELLKLWYRILSERNPGCDFLIVDCCSPIPPADFMGWGDEIFCLEPEEPPGRPSSIKKLGKVIVRFVEDVGHPFYAGGTPLDGGSQAIVLMASYAMANGYDHLVTIEGDVLFAPAVEPICAKLARHKIGWASPLEPTYRWVENQIMFLDVEWLRETNFIERFGWKTPVNKLDRKTYVEVRMERDFAEDLFILPIRGFRNEGQRVTWNNIDKQFEDGCLDYLCHCADFGLYEKFLRLHGIKQPALVA